MVLRAATINRESDIQFFHVQLILIGFAVVYWNKYIDEMKKGFYAESFRFVDACARYSSQKMECVLWSRCFGYIRKKCNVEK